MCVVVRLASARRVMSDRAEARTPAEAAADAVKAYIRLNRESYRRTANCCRCCCLSDSRSHGVGDLQRYVIERLREENAALRSRARCAEVARANRPQDLAMPCRRRCSTFSTHAPSRRRSESPWTQPTAFGAARAAFCVEGDGVAPKTLRRRADYCTGNSRGAAWPGSEPCGSWQRRRAAVGRLGARLPQHCGFPPPGCGATLRCCSMSLAPAQRAGLKAKSRRTLSSLRARSNAAFGHGSICRGAEARVACRAHAMSGGRARTRCAPIPTMSPGFSHSLGSIRGATADERVLAALTPGRSPRIYHQPAK